MLNLDVALVCSIYLNKNVSHHWLYLYVVFLVYFEYTPLTKKDTFLYIIQN